MVESSKGSREYQEALYDQRNGDEHEFDSDGFVPYTLTVAAICLRPGKYAGGPCMIEESELATDEHGGVGVISEFLEDGRLELNSGHEVLVGQSHVVDYLETTSKSTRYVANPGEYMFAVIQSRKNETDAKQRTTKRWREATNTPHNTHMQTARRALQEEFGVRVPESASFAPVLALQTRKIKGSSNLTVTYIEIAEDESSLLHTLDLDTINGELQRRLEVVEAMLHSGSWDELPLQEKEALCPRVRKLLWLDVKECMLAMQGSISWHFLPVNEWQAEEFAFHGFTLRSSMSTSLASLLRVEVMGREKLLARAERFRTYAPQEADAELRHLIDVENQRFSKDAKRKASKAAAPSKL